MDKSIWEKTIRENADEKGVGLCNRSKRRVCAKKGESVSVVERRKRVYSKTVEEEVYLTIKVTTDSASILHREKGWKEENGPGL